MPSRVSLSIIVPTIGRETLTQTLASITPQLRSGDEVIVIYDENAPWGSVSRDKGMAMATGTHLMFMDDDDVYLPGALAMARSAAAKHPGLLHIFRMKSEQNNDPWTYKQVRIGNVGTPMFVVPNIPELPTWWEGEPVHECDFMFVDRVIKDLRMGVIWHDEFIAEVRPHEGKENGETTAQG